MKWLQASLSMALVRDAPPLPPAPVVEVLGTGKFLGIKD